MSEVNLKENEAVDEVELLKQVIDQLMVKENLSLMKATRKAVAEYFEENEVNLNL